MEPIKIGFVGFGLSTNCFHLPFVLPNKDLEVYAFLQRAPPSQPNTQWGHCTKKFPKAKHYQTKEEFFADPAIEVVVLAVANHEDLAIEALKAGKHVVAEKPFANTSSRANEIIQVAKESGKILTVFQNRRLDSDYRTLRHLVTSGALGDIKEAEIHFDYPNPHWISGWTQEEYVPGLGNAFELGSHSIDQALYLFGRPASVTALMRCNRGGKSALEDTFTIILQYNGDDNKDLVVTVKTAIVSVMKDQLKFFVRGTKGTFLKFGTCPQEKKAIAAPTRPAVDPNFGVEDEGIWGTLTTADRPFDSSSQKLDESSGHYIGKFPSLPGWYRGYYENLVDAIRGKGEIMAKPETSRDGIRVIELARKSHLARTTVPWTDTD